MNFTQLTLISLLAVATYGLIQKPLNNAGGIKVNRGAKHSKNRRQKMREQQRQRRLRQQNDHINAERQNNHGFLQVKDDEILDLDGPEINKVAHASLQSKVIITDPQPNSHLMGGNFFVGIDVAIDDEKLFWEKYEGAQMCFSLDDAPWHCWSARHGRVHYSQAVEGPHTLVAILYHNNTLLDDFKSETVSFNVVHDPEFGSDGDTKNNTMKSKSDANGNGEEDEAEKIHIDVPVVQIMAPINKATYPGNEISFHSQIQPSDPDIFEKYFNHSFVCINMDAATAHSCFPIYGQDNDTLPIITAIPSGLHTIEAALMHPNTRDLINITSSETKTFFTSGNDHKEAAFIIHVTVDGEQKEVPVVRGSDFRAQAHAFCASIFLPHDNQCIIGVEEKLIQGMNLHGIGW
mmetsp:Transcript_14369/g.22156  ORF Transcript_14369/g.22156 Transcript_14369/m.22156 type:complete len:405 (-) Transcript_14369:465-1679(-)